MRKNIVVALILCISVREILTEKLESQKVNICSHCECLGVNPFLVDCSDMDFKKLPTLEKDLQSPWQLQLQGNAITSIPMFPHYENLTSISFRYNMISSIEERAFSNLTKLIKLDISHNNLTSKSINSETFRGPFHGKLPDPIPLKDLNLSHNQLKRLLKHAFKHLSHLTSLDLSYNPFRDLSRKTAEAISELQTLRKLDLSYTKLMRLPDHFFAELIYLEELDLSGNNFIMVPAEVNYASSLKSLALNNNIFGIITPSCFWETMIDLETLYLKDSTTLFEIQDGAFGNLTALKTLWLNNNIQLRYIFPRAFMDKFNWTIHLKELHLENNDLLGLPEYALPWKEIPYLNLQDNPWNCDCEFEWLAKDLLPHIQTSNADLTVHVTCAEPVELMGLRVMDPKVQEHHFVCENDDNEARTYGFLIISMIMVGTLLLVTATIIFSYVLFKRTRVYDWSNQNVQYKRTFNEDDEGIVSNPHY